MDDARNCIQCPSHLKLDGQYRVMLFDQKAVTIPALTGFNRTYLGSGTVVGEIVAELSERSPKVSPKSSPFDGVDGADGIVGEGVPKSKKSSKADLLELVAGLVDFTGAADLVSFFGGSFFPLEKQQRQMIQGVAILDEWKRTFSLYRSSSSSVSDDHRQSSKFRLILPMIHFGCMNHRYRNFDHYVSPHYHFEIVHSSSFYYLHHCMSQSPSCTSVLHRFHRSSWHRLLFLRHSG